jgi:hypothetical protein
MSIDRRMRGGWRGIDRYTSGPVGRFDTESYDSMIATSISGR